MIIDPEIREVGGPVVTLRMSKVQAEAVSSSLADVLCWIRGWQAAANEDQRRHAPLSVDELRELNIALKRAIGKAEP